MNFEVLKIDLLKELLYLPDLSDIDPLDANLAQFFPEKAKFDRQERLRRISRPDPTPDETTTFTYSSDNNMTHADLTDGSDLDFAYDAAGRRLEKKYTKVINNVTYETKYTYHYIGSQITTIDISGKEDETVVKNDQMRIHLGANSRPISFEYYTDIGTEQQASETYYYHYDLHGNVIRVTDDTGTTEITYTYDALGTIVSETNANSIYNPFTWSGEAQIIHDPEFNTSAATPKTGLYNSGSGYYNPETGTFLSGTGTPASTNPTSASAEEPTAQSTRPASQLDGHIAIAIAVGGIPSSDTPASSYDAPSALTVDNDPSAVASTAEIEIVIAYDDGINPMPQTPYADSDIFGRGTTEAQRLENWKKMQPSKEKAEDKAKEKKGHWERGDNNVWKWVEDEEDGQKTGSEKDDKDGRNLNDFTEQLKKNAEKLKEPHFYPPPGMNPFDGGSGTEDGTIAGDHKPWNDNTEYIWVIRDKKGNIVACQPIHGDPIVFPVDENGNRVSDTPCSDVDSTIRNWKRILRGMNNDKIGDGSDFSVQIFDEAGQPTDGCIAFDLIDGDFWAGIYVQKDGKYKTKTGKASDFGYNKPINQTDKPKRGSFIACINQGYQWNTEIYFYNNGYGNFDDEHPNPPNHWIEEEKRWEYIP